MTEIVEDLLLLLVIETFAANIVPKFHFARLAVNIGKGQQKLTCNSPFSIIVI